MTRCYYCRRFVWPGQRTGPKVIGSCHRSCWVRYYEARLADSERTGVISWDDVLVSPSHVSTALMAIADRELDRKIGWRVGETHIIEDITLPEPTA